MIQNFIRPIVICLCSFQNKILVAEDFEHFKQEVFYRPPGGGINFGERGTDAVIREFQEEFALDLTDIQYLFTLENIFEFENHPRHEIVLVYDAKLVDASLYGTILSGIEGNETLKAYWRSLHEIENDHYPLYPQGLKEKLTKMNF